MPWILERTPTFKRGYKGLSEEDKSRVNEALRTLAHTDNPASLGVRKKGPLRDLFAYEIGLRIRILYTVEKSVIKLLRVGRHTEVYR